MEQEGRAIGNAVGAHFGAILIEQLARTLTGVEETTAEMAKCGEAMATAMDAVQEMLAQGKAQGTDNVSGNNAQLADAVGNVLACTEEAVHILKEKKEQCATQMTYPAKVRGNVPSNYEQAALVAKGNLLDRQVVVRKAHDAESDQLASLTERELVQKVTIALELMGIAASNRPTGMKFIGVRRTQSGTVIYTLDATASADYLCQDDVMRAFMDHFRGTSALHARAYQVVVEHVPVTFDVTSTDALRRAEEASGLPCGAIYEARWIKPTHLRGLGQKVAFIIMGFSSRETANHAMNYGVVLEGKHCRTRKLLPELKRCVKCQGYGHFARECTSTRDVCAQCAGKHRTTDQDCPVEKGQTTKCANCNTTGHGAADRSCDEYKRRLAQMRARDPDSRFRLFPTDDPDTWGRAEGHAPMDEFNEAWRNDQRDWLQRDPHPQRGGAKRQGTRWSRHLPERQRGRSEGKGKNGCCRRLEGGRAGTGNSSSRRSPHSPPTPLLRELVSFLQVDHDGDGDTRSLACQRTQSTEVKYFPLWVISYWNALQLVCNARKCWETANRSLQKQSQNKDTAEVVTEVCQTLEELSWYGSVRGFSDSPEIDYLHKYLTTAWLSTIHEEQMLDLLQVDLIDHHTDPDAIVIEDTNFIRVSPPGL